MFSASAIFPKDLNASPRRAGASIFRGGRPIVCNVRTTITKKSMRPGRPRSRFGYDHRWWGESEPRDERGRSYWSTTRRPLPCLVFVAPILLAYELGVLWLGGDSADALRTGADAWMRHGLVALSLTDQWFLPLSLVLVLVGWQAVDRRDWRFPPATLLGMAIESVVLAIAPGRAEQGGRPRVHPPGTGRGAEPGRHRPGRRPPGGPLDRVPGRGGLRGSPVPARR